MSKRLVAAKEYKVKNGDTLESIAKEHGLSVKQIAQFNWSTDDAGADNIKFRDKVGSRTFAADNKTYKLSKDDEPGIIYVPEKSVSPKTFATNGTHTINAKLPTKNTKTSHCLVHFRPNTDWVGEYGFDWMRVGDTTLSGDLDYKTCVDKHDDLKAFYNPERFPNWKKNADGSVNEYLVPWAAIYPADQTTGAGNLKKSKITVKLSYTIENTAVEKLKFKYDKKYFKLSHEEIANKAVGNYTKAASVNLEIECILQFPEDQFIEVQAITREQDGSYLEYIAGKIRFVKNLKDNRHKARVVFVNMQTNINGTPKIGNLPASEKATFKQQFHQVLTSIDTDAPAANVTINIKDNAHFLATYTMEDGGIKKIISNPSGHPTVFQWLVDLFNDDDAIKKSGVNYADYLKIFVFAEQGGIKNGTAYYGAGGEASGIPSPIKCVSIYDLHKSTAPVHEFLHAMGLTHTFQTSAHPNKKFTYLPKKCTDNIMDYSDIRQSTWKWQWDILKASGYLTTED